MGRNRPTPVNAGLKKKAGKPSGNSAAAKKEAAASQPNPYEVFQNRRRKRAVLGERVRGEKRDVARSRAASARERAVGLLRDSRNMGRSSTFKDGRLGEMGGEGKDARSVQRLVRLRQREAKKSFALGASGGKGELTIGGKAVEDIDDDDLRAQGLSGEEEVDDNGEGALDEDPVERSKRLKLEAAKEKEQQERQLEDFDADFGGMLGELQFRPPKAKAPLQPKDKPDDYDCLVRQLAMDRRVVASDRTKTPEEIAREKAERLEELEKKRLAREQGEEDSGDEQPEEDGSEDEALKARSKAAKADNEQEASNEDEADGEDEEGEEEEEEDDGQEAEDSEGEENSGEGEADDADDAVCSDGRCLPLLSASELEGLDIMANGKDEQGLPYKFDCPESAIDVAALLEGKAPKTCLKVAQRIRACTAVALSADNRAKLKAFFVALLEYAISVLAREDGDISARGMQVLYALRPVLLELSGEYPDEACSFFAQRLGKLGPEALPTAKSLACAKLVTLVFPASDLQHPIVTPTSILVDHWASRIAGLGAGIKDLVSDALLLWEVLHALVAPAQRYSAAFFGLGAALLETCWASAAAGRAQCAEAAKDVGKLLLETLQGLKEADEASAQVAVEALVLPALRRAAASDAEPGRTQAAALQAALTAAGLTGTASLKPLQLFETGPAQIRVLDPIFHEEGDRPLRGAELTETKRLKRELNQERRAANRQLSRDAAALQQIAAGKDSKRQQARSAERARVRGLMEGEKQMLAQLKTESGGGMDTSLGSYSKTKQRKKENQRVGGNATDASKRMGTPKDPRGGRRVRQKGGGDGAGGS
eukprot:TRINITY_DN770_c0_g8_i1.p1 TRINITY_DN770_c0_g8~~TRINITY_DN770_c0_g8_i1.p1  ORF type:complete len:826 (-),score=245.29 TRINITY_DN770_c0_g8_i1:115-2592(-)